MPKKMESNRRCRNWEAFDRIELAVEPRYKTSEMSGDEWRTSVAIRFYFKGRLVLEDGCCDMQSALLLLGRIWVRAQEPISDKVIEREMECCDQPGCSEAWTVRRFLKRLACNEGWLAEENSTFRFFRKFCRKHERRGDCGLEDADRNYELPPEEQS